MAVAKYDQFDFLIDIVPRDELKPQKRQVKRCVFMIDSIFIVKCHQHSAVMIFNLSIHYYIFIFYNIWFSNVLLQETVQETEIRTPNADQVQYYFQLANPATSSANSTANIQTASSTQPQQVCVTLS